MSRTMASRTTPTAPVRKAPRVTSRPDPRLPATSTTVLAKVRHRLFGSDEEKRTTPRPSTVARENSHSGHSMTRVTPSLRRTVGRLTWKSKNSSGSSWANVRPSQRSRR